MTNISPPTRAKATERRHLGRGLSTVTVVPSTEGLYTMRCIPIVAASVALTACLAHPPPPPPPPEIAAAASVEIVSDAVAAGRLDRFVGRYASGPDSIGITRSGNQLVAAAPPPAAPQGLRMIGLGTFIDGAGTTYLFTFPPDRPGAMLHTRPGLRGQREWRRFP